EMLNAAGMNPIMLGSAGEALAWLHELEERNESVPLIIVDAMMPEVDGFAFAQIIRNKRHHAGAAILMLSSSDQARDLIRCRELGVSSYLLKPIKQSELVNAIVAALASQELEEVPRTAGAMPVYLDPSTQRRLRILLAEDNK